MLILANERRSARIGTQGLPRSHYPLLRVWVLKKLFSVKEKLAEGGQSLGNVVHCSSAFLLDFQLRRNVMNVCRHKVFQKLLVYILGQLGFCTS